MNIGKEKKVHHINNDPIPLPVNQPVPVEPNPREPVPA